MRLEFVVDAFDRDAFEDAVGTPFAMQWQLTDVATPKRVAILVSRYDHCLVDLLWRWERGELHCDVGAVISNHEALRGRVEAFGVPFVHVPMDDKPAGESRMLELLAGQYDLVVLARYMQILSGDFLESVGAPVMNIHHSFLPAFAGADPYRRAKERGVKIIGATAHYVTEELDAGPIVEQDVQRVTHRDDVAALTRAGEEIERTVLARAVRLHLEDRVVVDQNTTVIL